MLNRRSFLVVFASMMLFGCQTKLSADRKFSIGPGDSHEIMIDGPKYDQKVAITLSVDQPVDVAVYLRKDVKSEKRQNPLGSLKKATSGSFEVQIPSKEEFVVIVDGSAKAASGSITIQGK